jgi:hypothetical protein
VANAGNGLGGIGYTHVYLCFIDTAFLNGNLWRETGIGIGRMKGACGDGFSEALQIGDLDGGFYDISNGCV